MKKTKSQKNPKSKTSKPRGGLPYDLLVSNRPQGPEAIYLERSEGKSNLSFMQDPRSTFNNPLVNPFGHGSGLKTIGLEKSEKESGSSGVAPKEHYAGMNILARKKRREQAKGVRKLKSRTFKRGGR